MVTLYVGVLGVGVAVTFIAEEDEDDARARIVWNTDDDNGNGIADYQELTPVAGEDDLLELKLDQYLRSDEHQGLGRIVRHLLGLDRGAAKEAMAEFISGKTLSANQIEFINLIVNHLTQHGVMEASRLYESPFTDLTPQGPDGLFTTVEVVELIKTIERVNAAAVAA